MVSKLEKIQQFDRKGVLLLLLKVVVYNENAEGSATLLTQTLTQKNSSKGKRVCYVQRWLCCFHNGG